jgi:glutaredoxin
MKNRLFGGVVVLIACLCDPLEAFHPSTSRSLDPVRRSQSAHHQRVPISSPLKSASNGGDEEGTPARQPSHTDRRTLLKEWTTRAVVLGSLSTAVPAPAHAAPPISIIAEELGYFPIQSSKTGKTIYVPKRVSRESSEQAVKLAAQLTAAGVTMYGAFWCPHCSRQKEMFGQKAWGMVQYVECAPQGYNGAPAVCAAAGVDGYPTWVFADGSQVSGERTLEQLAKQVGFKGFRADMETKMPSGSGECK